MKSIKELFSKSSDVHTAIDKKSKKTAVVINTLDHRSLTLGSIFAHHLRTLSGFIDTYTGQEPTQVVMVDIRSMIPEDCGLYIWVDVGDHQSYCDYFTNAGSELVNIPAETVEWLKNLSSKSIFVNGMKEISLNEETEGIYTHTLLAALFMQPEEWTGGTEKSEEDAEKEYQRLHTEAVSQLYSVGFMGMKWMSLDISPIYTARYSTLLDHLYHSYYSAKDFPVGMVENFNMELSEESEDLIVKSYSLRQQKLNALLSLSHRPILVGSSIYLYFTDMSVAVHSIIRRAGLSNQKFIHSSEGMFGNIIFTNGEDQSIVQSLPKGTFIIKR